MERFDVSKAFTSPLLNHIFIIILQKFQAMVAIAIVWVNVDMGSCQKEASIRFPQGGGGKTLEDVEK